MSASTQPMRLCAAPPTRPLHGRRDQLKRPSLYIIVWSDEVAMSALTRILRCEQSLRIGSHVMQLLSSQLQYTRCDRYYDGSCEKEKQIGSEGSEGLAPVLASVINTLISLESYRELHSALWDVYL